MRSYVGLFTTLSLIASIGSAAPALAQKQQGYAKQHSMVDTTGLPPVQFHRDRLKLQVVDEGPEWTDRRRQSQATPNYDGLKVPGIAAPGGAAPAAIPAEILIGGGGTAGGGGNPMVNTAGLAPTGFQTNIPPHGSQPANLPNGLSSGGHVSGQMAAPRQSSALPSVLQHAPSSASSTTRPAAAVIQHYNGAPGSVGSVTSSGGASVNTSVKGVLRKMLDKQK